MPATSALAMGNVAQINEGSIASNASESGNECRRSPRIPAVGRREPRWIASRDRQMARHIEAGRTNDMHGWRDHCQTAVINLWIRMGARSQHDRLPIMFEQPPYEAEGSDAAATLRERRKVKRDHQRISAHRCRSDSRNGREVAPVEEREHIAAGDRVKIRKKAKPSMPDHADRPRKGDKKIRDGG